MTLIELDGRPYVSCEKCRQNVVWPQSLSAEDKTILGDECRYRGLRGMKLAMSKFGFDLREGKALLFHITRERGKCNRCGTNVTGEVSICPNCHSANLDW
jgi:hypothetical protein